MTPQTLYELSGLALGLLLGSFLNVCIYRLPRGESIVSPGSHCPNCGHPVRWFDNIPLLSWLLLRARCRDCHAPIPWRYPAVELATGLWFAVLFSHLAEFHSSPISKIATYLDASTYAYIQLAGIAALGFLLLGLIVMDWQTHRLPDAFTLTGCMIGFLLACTQAIFLPEGAGDVVLNTTHQLRLSSPGSFASHGNVFLTGSEALVFGRLGSIAAAALLMLAIRWTYRQLRHREGMGLGDVKLLAMIAAFLGLAQSLLALFLGVIAASLYGLVLLARRRAEAATRLPFGSFLAAGGLVAALYGTGILDWYTNLFR